MDSEANVATVEKALSDSVKALCDAGTAARFLRAEKGNVPSAIARLQDHLEWWRDTRPDQLVCKCCKANPRSHYLHPIGHDLGGRPVMYSCFALAEDRSIKGNKAHMIMAFEQTIKLMKSNVEKWVWFADFSGFGVKDCSPAVGKAFLDLASKHYPERLGCFILCGAPSVFSILHKTVMLLADPITREKVRLLPYDIALEENSGESTLNTFLKGMFPQETKDWLLHEMAENRTSAVKTKKYCAKEIYDSVTSKGVMPTHWGSKPLLQALVKNPDILMPQAGSGAAHAR